MGGPRADVDEKKMRIDYQSYRWSGRELFLYSLMALALTGIFAFLFYQSFWAMAAAVVVVPMFLKSRKKRCIQKRKDKLLIEFCDGMQAVVSAMQAGYSVENAWVQGEKECEKLYGREALMTREFARMNHSICMRVPMEKLVTDFAVRCQLEDVQNFAAVFTYARRNGGNMKSIIETTTGHIRDKQELLGEIQTLLAAKKLEAKIMDVMPLAILFYVTLTNRDYLEMLYHNLTGILIMSACLAGYLAAFWWSEKIVNIVV